MSDRGPIAVTPATLPYAYPLDALYALGGLPLPPIEKIPGEEVPEPYRTLLVHNNDMTPTLEGFHGASIHLRILHREQRGDYYYRQVALVLDGSEQPVEFGANKVSLLLFPPKARQLILEERVPLGTILKQCQVGHQTIAKAFFRVAPDDLIASVLQLNDRPILFGRKATIMDPQKRPLSEIVEILPPAA
jgi:hypothetical protein